MRSGNAWLLFIALLIGGMPTLHAATPPLATPDEDRRAKQALPPAGKALLYVYRLDDKGPELSPTLSLNTRELTRLAPRTYGMWAVNPGRIELSTGGAGTRAALRCQDGRIYFVQMTVQSSGTADLRVVSYAVGRRSTQSARLLREPRKAEEAGGQIGVTLIAKIGNFRMSSASQTIVAARRNFSASAFAWGVEGEWRVRDGWAVGGEVLGHTHDYTTTASSASGDVAVTSVLVNAKKYFRLAQIEQPYVGAGIGAVSSRFSAGGGGGLTGSATGYALQAMTGVAFRWQNVGVYTELKLQKGEAEDRNGEKLDVSGLGLFVGVDGHF